MPKICRHKLSLYAHISKIVWDFERPERVMGIVDDPGKANIGPFDLGQENTFDAVNQLWEIINGSESNVL
jgi:kinetochore protein Spc24